MEKTCEQCGKIFGTIMTKTPFQNHPRGYDRALCPSCNHKNRKGGEEEE